MHEFRTTTEAGKPSCFLTLTLSPEHMPADRSLDVRHWQLFAKAVRNAHGKFRFFHAGEYGDLTGRAHYHAIIFGLDWSQDRSIYEKTKHGDTVFTSPTLAKLWPHGRHVIGDVTFESCAYVAGYIFKKVTGQYSDEFYERVGLEHEGEVTYLKREYATMSRRPGIGHDWFQKYWRDVYPADEVIVNGKKCRPPVFYDNLLAKLNPKLYDQVKLARVTRGKKHTKNNTRERLDTREEVLRLKQARISREIHD